MLHVKDTLKHAEEDALLSRMWSHTIGVVNQKRKFGTSKDGRPGNKEVPGMASAIRWRQRGAVSWVRSGQWPTVHLYRPNYGPFIVPMRSA